MCVFTKISAIQNDHLTHSKVLLSPLCSSFPLENCTVVSVLLLPSLLLREARANMCEPFGDSWKRNSGFLLCVENHGEVNPV